MDLWDDEEAVGHVKQHCFVLSNSALSAAKYISSFARLDYTG